MKLEIDTTRDSPEEIQAAIQMLQAHIRNKGVYPRAESQPHSQNNYEDKIARKIERTKAKQEKYTQEASETPVSMSMFDTPTTPEGPSKDEEPEDSNVRIIPY